MIGTFPRLDEAKRIIIDIETRDPLLKTKGASWVYGLGHIVGCGIKIDNEPAQYYPFRHQHETGIDREQFKKYLLDVPNTARICGHYSYYDYGWLFKEFGWLHQGPHGDTLLAGQLYNNTLSSFSLDSLCDHFNLGRKSDIGDPARIWQLPIVTVASYCCQDIELTAKLDDRLWQERDSEAYKRECGIIPILVQMKAKGIKINLEQLDEVQKHLHQLYEKCMAENPLIKNIWANASVATLFRRLGIPYISTTKGTPSFPDWYLQTIDHPTIQALARARKLHKLINTFCQGIRTSVAEDGKIHPDFFNGRSDYGGTVTGRLSSANINVQQIPHRTDEGMLLRTVFVPDNLAWYKFDYSQQEPKLMLHYASKLNLKDIERWRIMYQNSPDTDFYKPIQDICAIPRFEAKTNTLGLSYNMGYEKMARMLKCTLDEAKQNIIKFNAGVPWMRQLKQYVTDKAQREGKIRTIGNRFLHFTAASASDSFNHLIQGSAADQIKQAMLDIYQETDLVPLLQVHDELGYDFTEEMILDEKDKEIEEIMINAFRLDFPTKVDVSVGRNWKECG